MPLTLLTGLLLIWCLILWVFLPGWMSGRYWKFTLVMLRRALVIKSTSWLRNKKSKLLEKKWNKYSRPRQNGRRLTACPTRSYPVLQRIIKMVFTWQHRFLTAQTKMKSKLFWARPNWVHPVRLYCTMDVQAGLLMKRLLLEWCIWWNFIILLMTRCMQGPSGLIHL